jgi:hypothetical protein
LNGGSFGSPPLGERVEQEYGQPFDRLFAEGCRVILRGLQAP